MIMLEEISDAFTALTTLAAQVPGVEEASMSRLRSGQFDTLAATAELPKQVDEIQYALGTGPCVDAILENHTFLTGDLRPTRAGPCSGGGHSRKPVC
jgi:hypothetical protein